MTLHAVLPQLTGDKRPAKDLVLSTLANKHPLTLAKITNHIKKTYGQAVTFQGVRKAAQQLVESGVVEKDGKEYALSKTWINQLRDFAEGLHEQYFSENIAATEVEAIGEDLKVYTFDNMIAVDQFINFIIGGWFEQDPGNIFVHQGGHAYFIVGNLEEESRINERIKELNVEFYTIVNDTPADNWAGEFFRKQGFFFKTTPLATQHYSGSYKDYYFQYEVPAELAKEIDAVYDAAQDYQELDLAKLIKLLRKQTEIKVTVMRNPLMAEQTRNVVLGRFKK